MIEKVCEAYGPPHSGFDYSICGTHKRSVWECLFIQRKEAAEMIRRLQDALADVEQYSASRGYELRKFIGSMEHQK